MVRPITTPTDNDALGDITRSLSAPFTTADVKWKPQAVKGNRALAIAYLDARAIQDRLDDVLGVEGWQDDYQILPDGSVVCKLQVRLGGEWVCKTDVGSPSEQPDGGDRLKAAFSDALKRAAVKFGIGRYLYRNPPTWVGYDPVKKQLLETPQIPFTPRAHANRLPSDGPAPVRPATAKKAVTNTADQQEAAGPTGLPENGEELRRRLQDYDAKLAREGRCQPGGLLAHVTVAGKAAGYGEDLSAWSGPAIRFAVDAVKAFADRPAPAKSAA